MNVADFDFVLPPERIAQRPASPRDSARLLVVVDTGLADRVVRDLPRILTPGDLVVVNDTRVLPVRLLGARGAVPIDVTLVKDLGEGRWQALVRRSRRLRPGHEIAFAPGFTARVEAKAESGEVTLAFASTGPALMAALERHGKMPLPPYIARQPLPDDADREDYQTVYAERPGAVAAPTAGLHFTPALLDALAAAGIGRATVTLHVGAGTFLPVKGERVEDHVLHGEWGEVGAEAARAIARTRAAGGRIVAVGTTTLRLLEAAAGDDGTVGPFAGETSLFITPGYRVRTADLLLTNFHLPRSTLFMLVCAFAGTERMKAAYRHAVAAGYRFYSYGDGSLLSRAPDPGSGGMP